MACRHTIFQVTEHISKTGKGSTVDGKVIVWSSITKKNILLHFVHPDTPKVGTLYKTEPEQGIFWHILNWKQYKDNIFNILPHQLPQQRRGSFLPQLFGTGVIWLKYLEIWKSFYI